MSFSFARDDFDAIIEAITHRADLLNLTTNPKHSIDAPSASAPGWPLAHANAVLVLRIYGRFMPTQQERDKWERICDIQGREWAAAPTNACTTPRNNMSQPQLSDWLIDSRGGTRTRDPGIMSAVL